ncbi:MAG TPA: cyclase family protein [Castellaniella sp.]|uniref:cyclase family protein n=1 Tax=Castellaniella sp. TaxID=1955812 RepID=UPI002F235FE5
MPRWTQRPHGANWGDFGPDDELGRLNWLGQEQVLKGVREVREGKTFCLSLPLELPGGSVLNVRRKAPRLFATERDGAAYMNFSMDRLEPDAVDVLSDDEVILSLQYSTQWDSFAHVGAQFDVDGSGTAQKVYYNGFRAGADIPEALPGTVDHHCHGGLLGARKLGIQNYAVKGMQGRGVLLDFVRHFGTGRTLIGLEELQSVLAVDQIQIERGDMLVLRTGFAEKIVEMAGHPDAEVLDQTGAVLDGSDEGLLSWISTSGITVLCADNYAVEAYPARTSGPHHSLLPLHHHCLFKLGLPLAELWYLRELADWLAEHGRHHFLLTAPPLRLTGAVGSPVTPIATV